MPKPRNGPPKTPRLGVVDGVTMHLRIPRDLHANLMARATAEHRTLYSLVVFALSALVLPAPLPPK